MELEKEGDLMDIPYDPMAFDLQVPPSLPKPYIPPENPLTVAGVELGHRLFFDPILSADGSMSCASCHDPLLSFSDGLAFSPGVDGIEGPRSSMALLNIAYAEKGLFWDGRVNTLEEQALLPIEDPIELHESWPNVIQKFRDHPRYPTLFRQAFGIADRSEITKELAAKAIAQYERTLISGDSKFDRVLLGEEEFTDDEFIGWAMFFDQPAARGRDAECGHCHLDPLMTTNDYFNNGLEELDDLNDFPDKGRGIVTGNIFDNGTFRATTLRNVALTAPYMHDGRFKTLDEVIDHYSSGGKDSPNKDVLIIDVNLSEEERRQLKAFLHTLTDTSYFNNPLFRAPVD